MSGIHPLRNTDEDLPCTNCGSPGNVVREANTPEAKKMKCLSCGFIYTAADSIQAKEAGAVPDAPPELTPNDYTPPAKVDSTDIGGVVSTNSDIGGYNRLPAAKLPRKPTFVLVSKARDETEFATAKTIKQVILKWEYESKKFDLFELTPRQATTKVDLQ